jgi:hypothetical protein
MATAAEHVRDILIASAVGGLAGILVFGELGAALTGTSHWAIGLFVGPFVVYAIIRSVRRA